MTTQPWAVAVGCFVAGSLAAAGIANATSAPTKIPDSNTGVITACMKKKTGKVRFINAQKGKTCTKKEKKVTFNQAGPQGEQGPAGAQGPIGPSKAYVNSTNPWIGFVVPSTGKTVASLSLPAGNYVPRWSGDTAADAGRHNRDELRVQVGSRHSDQQAGMGDRRSQRVGGRQPHRHFDHRWEHRGRCGLQGLGSRCRRPWRWRDHRH